MTVKYMALYMTEIVRMRHKKLQMISWMFNLNKR